MDLPPLNLFDNKPLKHHNPFTFIMSLTTMSEEGSVGQHKCDTVWDALANVASNNPLIVAWEASGMGYANG
jgi:hypothetical protein